MQLFYSEADDFLIVYSEVSDEDAKVRDRAYFIRQNASATEHGKKPHFATVEPRSLSPVPFTSDPVHLPRATLDRTLLTVTDSHGTETYTLASYPTGTATAVQATLTPFAVAGDVTITALIIGFIGLVGMAQSGLSISVN